MTFTCGWGYVWYDLLQDWIKLLRGKVPDFELDFIFPDVQDEGLIMNALIPRPMVYSKAASILRHVAKQPFMSPPYTTAEVTTLTVHSAKSALISAAKQLDLPQHWIAEQGHHRGKRTQGDRYSRDDTIYQLLLQKTIICKCKLGWRPVTPQARGGQHPIPQRPFIIPTGQLLWPPFLDIASSSMDNIGQDLNSVSIKDILRDLKGQELSQEEPSRASNQGSDVRSLEKESLESSSSSDSSPSSSDEENEQPAKGPFLLNHFTRIAHCVRKNNEGKYIPACGAKLFDASLYRISDELPSDFDLCHHKGCKSC